MRKFDLFPKVNNEEFDTRTKTGGFISILTFIFMLIIIYVEISDGSKAVIKQRLILDETINDMSQHTLVYFNLTVGYPCHLLTISIQDITGNHQLEYTKKITRQRLDKNHNPIAPPIQDIDRKNILNICGSCHGSNYTKCCPTCFDIAASFRLQNQLVPNLDNFEQCTRDQKAISDQENCQIIGELSTQFSKGQILINAGGQIQMPIHYKHDLTYFGDNANLSHWITTFRFGPDFDGLKNPLDNSRWLQRARGFFFYRYSLNLVKTISGKVTGNQYSAAANQFQISKTVSKRHPAIAFDFDTSPIVVKFNVEQRSILQMLTNLFAILGGGFTIGSLIDSFFFSFHSHKD